MTLRHKEVISIIPEPFNQEDTQAALGITTDGSVADTENVSLQAHDAIRFLPGFETTLGSDLGARIGHIQLDTRLGNTLDYPNLADINHDYGFVWPVNSDLLNYQAPLRPSY